MKSPISILTWLCLLFLASCISNKKTSLEAFKQDVYTPEYATGFKILGADNTASTLIQVSNPWQGAKDVKMSYFISRNGEQAPAGFTGPTIPAGAIRIVIGTETGCCPVIRYRRCANCRNRQTERTVYTLYVCRRIFGGIAAW